ncbi:putative alpha-amylase [Aspergillus avenaceus]|uniref:Putative alpha-amylase n=1 Tax=Aspergillus avenaceus TaxID=36643 RepID=A0A5N6U950_ASPAV|nr:putative alpha-amylase [Aspergillus avenaceus]
MVSFLSCLRRKSKGQEYWKKIEEKAQNLESLPSWTSPDNTLLMQGFEWHVPADCCHWRRLQRALPGLKTIGVDQIWLPPGCKGMDCLGNGYDLYDWYDLGEFDQKGARATKWGTREELDALMATAQDLGIGVYWDAVLNHKAGADYPERYEAVKVNPQQRNNEISKPMTINGWVGFEFRGRGDQYSPMKYHWQHFSGVDWDDDRKENAIYRTANKQWASDVSSENGNYDYLMCTNLDLSHPEVREDAFRWGTWISTELPLSGMRFDAAKHFSVQFQKDFVDHMRRTVNPDFQVFGEYWTGDTKAILRYLEEMEHRVSAVDTPLVQNFHRASYKEGADLRSVLKGTLMQCRPENALTFVANHDTQPGQMLETPISPAFKPLAYALILLRREGNPCVFYGDLYGINKGKSARKPACKGKLPLLTGARRLYAYGEQQDYFDQPNCIGFVRYGNGRHPAGLACVMSNGAPGKKRMYVGKRHAGEPWTDVMQEASETVVIDALGYGVFPVPGMSVSVWVWEGAEGRGSLLEEL